MNSYQSYDQPSQNSKHKKRETERTSGWWETDLDPKTRNLSLGILLSIVYLAFFYYLMKAIKTKKHYSEAFIFFVASLAGLMLGTKQSTWNMITPTECIEMCDDISTFKSSFKSALSESLTKSKARTQNNYSY
jgi:hypothetical protein